MSSRELSALIVGAGKVGRGFIAHILVLAGVRVAFVEWNEALVKEMERRGRYHIFIAADQEQEYLVQGYRIASAADREQVAAMVAETDLIFTAIGGERLASLGPLLAPGITRRAQSHMGVLNLITCENWSHPGTILYQSIVSSLPGESQEYFRESCGVAESTVYRACIEPTPRQHAIDPLAVQGTDNWQLQVDGDNVHRPFPEIRGIVPITGFQSALERKLFTYSALSATISYLGAVLGLVRLHEAASNPRVLRVAHAVLRESGAALCRRHRHSPQDQEAHAEESLAAFQNPRNPDTLERHARDPLRKLSRCDRLVGPATLCLEERIEPRALALAIAAGLRYAEPSDPSAVTLQQRLSQHGIETVLAEICGLNPQDPLAKLVKGRIPDVDRFIAGEDVV